MLLLLLLLLLRLLLLHHVERGLVWGGMQRAGWGRARIRGTGGVINSVACFCAMSCDPRLRPHVQARRQKHDKHHAHASQPINGLAPGLKHAVGPHLEWQQVLLNLGSW